jgi:hypothetical protein
MFGFLLTTFIAGSAIEIDTSRVFASSPNGEEIVQLTGAHNTNAEASRRRYRRCPPGHKRDRRGRCYWPYE